MDCLIIGYAEPSRNRERQQFFSTSVNKGSGFGRYLHLNYVGFEGDFVLPNHLASLAHHKKKGKRVKKDSSGGFAQTDLNHYSTWNIPLLGGLYLYQCLKSQGHETGLIKHVQLEREKFFKYLDSKPKVIAISTTLLLHPLDIANVVKECRDHSPDSFIILGGATTWTAHLARKNDFKQFGMFLADAVMLDAKGSKTLSHLVSQIKLGKSIDGIPNLLLFDPKDRSQILSCSRSQPEDFDFAKDGMDWNLIENDFLGEITWVQTQISCPFSCSFCSYPVVQGSVQKSDIESVRQTLSILQKRGVRFLLFVDDTFNVPKSRFIEFLKLLKQFDFTWYGYIRCQYLDEEQVKMMKESGCGGAYLGIESAHTDVLNAMNKAAKPVDYWKGVQLLANYGITTYGSFIIGFPGETTQSIEETSRFIDESGLDYYNIKCFYYDRSTPIHNKASQYDLTGSFFHWKHQTMHSEQAFDAIQTIIKETPNTFIPQHSGEIWELGYFRSLGFEESKIHQLYATVTNMMREEFSGKDRSAKDEGKILEELGEIF